MTPSIHELRFVHRDDAIVAHLSGEVDASNAREVEFAILQEAKRARLVIDLEQVDYFDSAGMAMLESLSRATRLRLALPSSTIAAHAIAITGLDQVIPRFESVEQALEGAW